MKKEEFIEECWFIYGVRIKNYFFGYPIYHSAGSSGHVEFDWKEAMHPMLLGWLHTHPFGFGSNPSETDNSTMRGWVRGRNKALVCGIMCGNDEKWFEYYRKTDGDVTRRNIQVKYISNFLWGKTGG
jgi:hypothetical protein